MVCSTFAVEPAGVSGWVTGACVVTGLLVGNPMVILLVLSAAVSGAFVLLGALVFDCVVSSGVCEPYAPPVSPDGPKADAGIASGDRKEPE